MKKGEAVVVKHKSENGNIVPAKAVRSKVDAVYLDGTVRVTSGDVWKVKYVNHQLETCL